MGTVDIDIELGIIAGLLHTHVGNARDAVHPAATALA
jgi:hypothetical protein